MASAAALHTAAHPDDKVTTNGRYHTPNPVFDSSPTFQMACRQLEAVADVIDTDKSFTSKCGVIVYFDGESTDIAFGWTGSAIEKVWLSD